MFLFFFVNLSLLSVLIPVRIHSCSNKLLQKRTHTPTAKVFSTIVFYSFKYMTMEVKINFARTCCTKLSNKKINAE